jgi:ABC-type oligopeptide transport system substrate-binding subunit
VVIETISSHGYEQIEKIGAGGFGEVYRAHQPTVGRDVAIKVVLPNLTVDPLFARRFEKEAQLAAQLEHPNIVPLYEYWQEAGRAFLVMRWLGGGNLKESLVQGPLSLVEAVRLLDQIAGALEAAHRHGVVHRDLKSTNILLDEAGNAYLGDFGIAKHSEGTTIGTPTGAIMGSPAYMAPEQIRGETVTTLSDIYSLGVVLFEVLTGETPFVDTEPATLLYKQLHEPLPLASDRRLDLPATVDLVIQKATAKDPGERYPDARSLNSAFGEAVGISLQFHEFDDLHGSFTDGRQEAKMPAFLTSEDQDRERPLFVGRDAELAWLDRQLNSALEGEGGVVFVTGEAGMGKSATLQAFADKASEFQSDLILTWGTCNAFTGSGDAYLPFRQVLAMLTGDVEQPWRAGTITTEQARRLWQIMPLMGEVLTNEGQALTGSLIEGRSLLTRAREMAGPGAEWLPLLTRQVERTETNPGDLSQAQLHEGFANVLRWLANERPVLILLDDLQWVDGASAELLFHLGRGLSGSHLLVVCAYRPEEVSLGRQGQRHPLEKIVAEFRRTSGEIFLDLGQVSKAGDRAFVDALLDSEPNALGENFRSSLFAHTGGQPLFVVETLRYLQERGDLTIDEKGRWTDGSALAWDVLPDRVEGVVGERIGRLEDELREILTVAAVEGEDFTVQVVARVQAVQERNLLRTLSRELEKRHQLVLEREARQIGRQLISRYRFSHALFQQYLYNDLGIGERRLLHGEIGTILEELYSGRTEEINVQLAWHYAEAGAGDKALPYLQAAGDKARLLFANQEAVEHYGKALAILKQGDDYDWAARTLMKLGLTHHNAAQYKEARQAYQEATEMWRQAARLAPSTMSPATKPLKLIWPESELLDPTRVNNMVSSTILENLFSGLLTTTADESVMPDIAQSWEMLEGGQRYFFHLRDDVYWSDGHPVTARDFEMGWKRILHAATESPNAILLYDLKGAKDYHQGRVPDPDTVGVRALDPYSLEVELDRPAAYFLYLMAETAVFPSPTHAIEKYGSQWATVENIVTNGAFRLETWRPGQTMVFVPYADYHGRRQGNVQRIELTLVPSSEQPGDSARYESENMDFLDVAHLSLGEKINARQRHAGEYGQRPSQSTRFVLLDDSEPPLNDLRIRQALASAIDKEMLAGVVSKGFGLPASGGFIPPGISGHSADIGSRFNPELARRLLAKAGNPGGVGLPEFTGVYYHSHYISEAEYLSDQWREILGIEFVWELITFSEFHERFFRRGKILPSCLFGWSADYPDPDSFLRTSFPVANTMLRTNIDYKALVEEARLTLDHEQRMQLYRKADRILVEEAIIVPLLYPVVSWLARPRLRNYRIKAGMLTGWKDIILDPH